MTAKERARWGKRPLSFGVLADTLAEMTVDPRVAFRYRATAWSALSRIVGVELGMALVRRVRTRARRRPRARGRRR